MSYTPKQYNYAKHMLLQLGMENDELVDKYLDGLEKAYGKMEEYYPYRWGYSVSDCILNIKEELNLKRLKGLIRDKSYPQNAITATALSSYVFCPASFSINNSFEIDAPSNAEATDTGLQLHEQLRLAQHISNYHQNDYNSIYDDPVLKLILEAEVVHKGHEQPDVVFENRGENFRGSPDYIFRTVDDCFFVVEEKFIFRKSPYSETDIERYNEVDELAEAERTAWEEWQPIFFNNHKVQLISYIRNITEYEIKYGYLIYWFYDFSDNKPVIHKFSLLKITLDESSELLYQKAKTGIIRLQTDHGQQFNIAKLNPTKCAACVVNKYCGHKTGKFDSLSLPYSRDYMVKRFVPKPKHYLADYLKRVFPGSDLSVQFGEIECDHYFTVSTPLNTTEIARNIFERLFTKEQDNIWVFIIGWDEKDHHNMLSLFFSGRTYFDSWDSNGFKQSFFIKKTSEVHYNDLFLACTNIDRTEHWDIPIVDSRIFFIDPKNNIVFMFWDDSVMVGGKSVETINPIYDLYYDYINENSKKVWAQQMNSPMT